MRLLRPVRKLYRNMCNNSESILKQIYELNNIIKNNKKDVISYNYIESETNMSFNSDDFLSDEFLFNFIDKLTDLSNIITKDKNYNFIRDKNPINLLSDIERKYNIDNDFSIINMIYNNTSVENSLEY